MKKIKQFLRSKAAWVFSALLLTSFCLQAQVGNYVFAASAGTYTPLAGGTAVAIVGDDVAVGGIPIGFDFVFNGSTSTHVVAGSNGWLSFNGASSAASGLEQRTNDLNFGSTSSVSTMRPLVAPLWDDLDGASGTGAATYLTTGTAPNRVFTFEWLDWQWNWQASGATISFQVKLYETTNMIEFIYNDEGGALNAPTASIGIAGFIATSCGSNSCNTGQFLSLDGTGASPMASFSTESDALATKPASGQIYSFTPPPPPALDITLTALVAPAAGTCYGASEAVTVSVQNAGTDAINFAANNATISVDVTGAATQNFMTTLSSGTLAPGASQNIMLGVLNMSTPGTYTFNGTVTMSGDQNASNNAMPPSPRTTVASTTSPHTQNFDASTSLPTGWATLVGSWFVSATHGQAGNGMYINNYSSVQVGEVRSIALGPISGNDFLTFDTRVLNWSGYPTGGAPTGNWGSLEVQISTNCGGSYSTVATYTDLSGTPFLNKQISLAAYAGQTIIVKFKSIWSSGDWYIDIDNFNIQSLMLWYEDLDGDTYGNPAVSQAGGAQPAGYVANNTDCNDNNAAINPAATEICNAIDDNCNGMVDEGVGATYYADVDGDSFGNPSSTLQACTQPAGYVANNTDCNDNNAAINPTATEICNGVDDNCNGMIDENGPNIFYADVDGDGFGNPNSTIMACTAPAGYVADNTDCNDNNAAIKPGATELCNGVDDNCNGMVDEGLTPPTWYADADGDGFGNPAVTLAACTQPAGYVANSMDCNDNNAAIKPGAAEICNGVDDNCNGMIDEGAVPTWYLDNDGDNYGTSTSVMACTAPAGYAALSGDCNDGNAAINPGMTELCNGIDDNCNGLVDETCGLCTVTLPACETVYVGYSPAAYTTLTAQPGGAGTPPFTYSWNNGATTQSVTVNPLVNTTYSVMMTDAIGCTATASTLVEAVNVKCGGGSIQVYVCHGGTTLCLPVRLVTAHLAHGDALGQCGLTVCDPFFASSNSGTSLMAPNGTGLDEFDLEEQLVEIYPNPASDEVSVITYVAFEVGSLRLFDMQGRVAMTRNLDAMTMMHHLHVGELAAGTYMVQFLLDGVSFTEKLVVE